MLCQARKTAETWSQRIVQTSLISLMATFLSAAPLPIDHQSPIPRQAAPPSCDIMNSSKRRKKLNKFVQGAPKKMGKQKSQNPFFSPTSWFRPGEAVETKPPNAHFYTTQIPAVIIEHWREKSLYSIFAFPSH